ncbi:ISL3 family transposase [Glutamicibacter sp. NPDC087344]|uniref:ISL3 family transposase n=1 Tax=Glutamicibacter sp. NPDC087344 TaxID=3363994 RepID=UPI003816A71C
MVPYVRCNGHSPRYRHPPARPPTLRLAARSTTLVIKHRRYRCAHCQHLWREDLTRAADPRQKISKTGLRWALVGLVCQHLSISRIAEGLGVSWNTANDAVLAEGQRLLINDPTRFNGVKVLDVNEHVWRHTRTGDKYVTVIMDLTAVRDGTGTARLLDMVPGRSKAVFKTWLAEQDEHWKQGIEVVAMDGFTGFKTAAVEELPQAVEVLDPFHVVKLGSEALDQTRQRVQREVHGRRGRKEDPLYKARRTLTTGLSLATEKQKAKLESLFKQPEHEPVQLVWSVYQRMVDAYRHPKPEVGRWAIEQLIAEIGTKVPKGLPELQKLGGTLWRRRTDILAYFDHIGSSNGPTEATAGWNICGVSPWDSRIRRTISHGRCWRPAGLGRGYTLNPEEPHRHAMHKRDPCWLESCRDSRNRDESS